MPAAHLVPLLLLLALSPLSPVRAALTNLTIDDSNDAYFTWTEDVGSPKPLLPWAAITPATPCDYCSAQPPTQDIENKTWHDGTNNSAGAFTFPGSAVWIYGIDLANPANISFTLDGDSAPPHYYTGSEQFVFRSLFFAARNLAENVNHTVAWVLHATKTNGTVGLFDYAVITVDDSSSGTPSGGSSTSTSTPVSSKSKSKTGPIVGGVVGGVALIAVITAVVFFLGRRRRHRGASTNPEAEPASRVRANHVEPFVAPAPTEHSLSSPTSGGEKTLDVSWANPATTDVSSLPASHPPASQTPLQTPPEPSIAAPSSRERYLEDRLAQLEAQVNQHLPPAYDQPPRE